jgi:hypothetical protein
VTSEEIRAAVERIKADPEFAQRAYEQPEAVLPIEYDLDPAQWQAVHRALATDADPGDEEVAGFELRNWGSRQIFPNLDALVSSSGTRQHKSLP